MENTIKYHYKIGRCRHEIEVDPGSHLLLDARGKPLVDQCHMKKMNRLFKSWIKFAEKQEIVWVCQGGTLLGAARQSQGHLYWDDDIDVNVLDYDKLFDLQGACDKDYVLNVADAGFIYHHKDAVYPFIDVWVLTKKNDSRYIMSGPFVDRQPMYWLDIFWPKEYMYKEEFDNRIKVKFEDYEVYVPRNYIEVVKRQFGENVLTNYYYDKNKEIHRQMVDNWIYNNIFSVKNRFLIADWCSKNLNKRLVKYGYNLVVLYSSFNMEETKLNLIIDEYLQEKKYLHLFSFQTPNLKRDL